MLQQRSTVRLFAAFALIIAASACGTANPDATAPDLVLTITTGSDGQSGARGSVKAVTVHVADASGTAKAGVGVGFAIASGGGTVTPVAVNTNASGDATTNWTLGQTAGAQSLTATLANKKSVTINATAQ